MASALLFLVVFIAVCASQVSYCRELHDPVDEDAIRALSKRHEEWMVTHGKVYKTAEEKEKRFNIFRENVKFIDAFNNDNANEKKPFKISMNKFGDLSNDEFRARRNGYTPRIRSTTTTSSSSSSSSSMLFKYENVSRSSVPSSVDWRMKGAVTPIKDQQQCGSCWAFSAVAAIEGITKISKGMLMSLSEQEILDCDNSADAQGCQGGLMESAFDFIAKNGGITSEYAYPYQAQQSTCASTKSSFSVAKIKGYQTVPENSESSLLKAVAHQPVSVAIDAGGQAFQFYSGGVFTGDCGTTLDHGVAAIGYGTAEDGTKYWLIKNSWGTSWGEQGYVRIQRDVGQKEGLCGIAMDASYPLA